MSKRVLVWLVGSFSLACLAAAETTAAFGSAPLLRSGTEAGFGRLPLVFEENHGQTAQDARFVARGRGYTLLVAAGELVFILPGRPSGPVPAATVSRPSSPRRVAIGPAPREARIVRLRFSGSNPHPEILGVGPLPGRAHYLGGSSPDTWVRDVPTFSEVLMRELYQGVDLRLYTREGDLEYDLVLQPGADLSSIELKVEGADTMSLRDDGAVALETPRGRLVQAAPVVYQESEGRRRQLAASYRPLSDGRLGFDVPRRDPAVSLVIDPVITYSTYFGGEEADTLAGVKFDPQGNLYLHGYTASVRIPALPVTAPRDHLSWFEYDAFLVQLSASGRTVLSWFYLGGRGTESIAGFEFDAEGHLLVAGTTDGRDFPLARHAREPLVGWQDVWLAKIDPRRGELLYVTVLGGSEDEWLSGFGVDRWGSVYLVGGTLSPDLPTTAGAFQTRRGGDFDCFVAKYRGDDGMRLATTYFGGFSTEFCDAAVVAPDGEVYLAGEVIDGGLPITPGVFQEEYGGHTRNYIGDAFVAKLDRTLRRLVYSSYLGGPRDEYAVALAVDQEGNAYLAGHSFGAGFPLRFPLQSERGLGQIAFVSKVDPTGSELLFSTYLGGSLGEGAMGLAFDPRWGLIVVGVTSSPDFPLRDPIQSEIGFDPEHTTLAGYPLGDAFVTVLTPTGDEILFSTFIGGPESDSARHVAVDPRGNIWIVAGGGPTGYPIVNALQPKPTPARPELGEVSDPILTKIEPGDPRQTPSYLTSPAFPDYRFAVRFLHGGISAVAGVEVSPCPPDTLCVAGALPGRTEVMVRMAGPKPNGRVWPHLVKFSTSAVEVLVEQLSTGKTKMYLLPGVSPTEDLLAGRFDRAGFVPMPPSWSFGSRAYGLRTSAATPPPGTPFTSPHYPDFRFRARISSGGQLQEVRREAACIEETLCLSGAIPGRSEVFLRIVGPKPNGRLWPTIVKFTTSTLEVWIEQVSSGETKYYRIEGAAPGKDDLTGLFDRAGFAP